MRWERTVLWVGIACASCAGAAFAGCSSTSASGLPVDTTDASDATADDSAAEASLPDDSSSPVVDAGPDASDAATDAEPDTGPEAGADASDGAAAADGGSDGAAACIPIDAGVPDDAAVADGLMVTTTFTPTCASCHGSDLSGGVAVGGATSKNLTPDPATGLGCWTDDQIVTAILYGTTPDGTTLCVMPKWINKGMTPEQAEDVVQYLRTLPPVSKVVPASACEIPPDAGTSDAGDAGP
jgi:mono/diheme cytochrome c family protein